jgi:hypothetical protein
MVVECLTRQLWSHYLLFFLLNWSNLLGVWFKEYECGRFEL